MAKRLTDKERKRIIADYAELQNYRAVGRLRGVSATTVKNIVKENDDFLQICADKKDENTQDILEYMSKKAATVCEIIGKGLDILNSDEKLKNATPAQITTALGTLIDKFTGYSSRNNKIIVEHMIPRGEDNDDKD